VHGNDCIYKEAEPHLFSFIACNNMKVTMDEHTCSGQNMSDTHMLTLLTNSPRGNRR
jgi:hypothetical protein